MASFPITSFMGNRRESSGNFVRFYFCCCCCWSQGGFSKITADGDCSHEIKTRLPLGRNVITNLDSIFKSRDITLPTKDRLVKAIVFSSSHVQMWEFDCEQSWTLKDWCFWTVVLEKTLESPIHCKEIQPVHSKEISPGCSLEGVMLKLTLQYYGHLIWRADSSEKTLMLEGIGGWRKMGQQRMSCLDSITDLWMWVWVISGSWWWIGRPHVRQFMGSQRVRQDWATELNKMCGKMKQHFL